MTKNTIAKPKHSDRRKQMLNWYRTANPEKFTDFHYTRWMRKVGGVDMKDAIYKASEDELDDLYILREELRLGI
jgi:patatin-like phospholipase/acyl hydrolase